MYPQKCEEETKRRYALFCTFSFPSTCFRHLQAKVAEPKFIASGEHFFFHIGFI